MDINAWINDVICGPGGYHDFQDHELAVEHAPHDVCVAAWVIRCLANPACPGSAEVLSEILARRIRCTTTEVTHGA